MKSRQRRRFFALFVIAVLIPVAVSCSGDDDDAGPNRDLQSITDNSPEVSFEHTIAEGITLTTRYHTDYDVKQWRITDTKTLWFEVEVKEASETTTILIENVHADVALQSTKQGLDGLPQDTMDDRLHVGAQPGFLITSAYNYSDVFSIEGFSDTLISGWGFATGGTGSTEINEERLTENNLVKNGVYGNKFTFVYDVLIQDPASGLFYKVVFYDEFALDVARPSETDDEEDTAQAED